MPVFSLSDLRAKVLGRVDENTALYPTSEIDAVINEAIQVLALFTGYYRTTIEVPGFTVANARVYATPVGILAASRVAFEGRELQKISLKGLARTRRNWATDTTATKGQVDYWAPIGRGQFVISPQDAVGGNSLAVTGMAEPPKLVNAGDVMALENEYVELIPEYAEHRLPLKEGGKIFADGSLALNRFYAKMKDRKQYEELKMQKYYLLNAQKAAPAA